MQQLSGNNGDGMTLRETAEQMDVMECPQRLQKISSLSSSLEYTFRTSLASAYGLCMDRLPRLNARREKLGWLLDAVQCCDLRKADFGASTSLQPYSRIHLAETRTSFLTTGSRSWWMGWWVEGEVKMVDLAHGFSERHPIIGSASIRWHVSRSNVNNRESAESR
jgi:hypothetical protein